MSRKEHWRDVYERKPTDGVSWYRPHLETSLSFIEAAGLSRDARVVDIGGGAATLVDDLLARGFSNLAVVDIAEPALAKARARLGPEGAARVDWVVGDVTTPLLPAGSVDFWHDRAVFHFLTEPEAVAAYLAEVHRAVKPGGHVMVATFGPEGPERCSGLPVQRYSAEGIHRTFGEAFEKLGEASEVHETPWGSAQAFAYCFCRVRPA